MGGMFFFCHPVYIMYILCNAEELLPVLYLSADKAIYGFLRTERL